MIVVSVKFKGRGKTYFFDPQGLKVPEGAQVVVETSKGMELAECVQGNHEVTDERIVPPLRPVVRVATADDLRVAELCKQREKEAFAIAEKKIAERGLDMKLVDVECNFEGSKILFFFTSDGRVDFRELVKDLAGIFRTRIELRQIGVRDEAKMLGGLGICGRPFCCHQFLDDFEPVSTKMAKTQSLSLNPTKISGSCGRLMCCLRYEQEAYEELVKHVPKNGAFVETTCGYGNVVQVNLLRQQVKVRMDGDDNTVKSFEAEEVAAVPGGRPKPGEPLPHVLNYVPKEKEPVVEERKDQWVAAPIFAEDTVSETEQPRETEQRSGGSHRHRNRNRKSGQGGGQPQNREQKEKPQEQKPAAPPRNGEKSAEGEKQHSSHRHRGRGGSRKPGEGGQNPGTQNGGGKPQGQNQNQAQKPHQNQPKTEGGERKPGEGGGSGEKKSGGNHFRHHRPRKPGGGSGEKKSGAQE